MRLGQALRNLLDLGNCIGIEQFAQIGLAQQPAQLVLVDGQRLGTALGQRRVAIIEKVGDIAEQQR